MGEDKLIQRQRPVSHDPRRGHPDPQKKFAAADEKQCLTCHNPAKSPKYHYRTYLLKVGCPK